MKPWSELSDDIAIHNIVKGVKIEFIGNVIPQQFNARPSVFNSAERPIVQAEIKKLLDKGIIVPCLKEPNDFVSTIFLRPKKDGTYRTILNLKQFNEFVQYRHFKMDTLEHAIHLMKPGCYMASVDLKDAYYTVPIHPSHQKYLKFRFGENFYQYTCLPNGLASAPRIFTKVLKPVYATLRSMGHVSSAYIDDSYLQGDTYDECRKNVHDTAKLFTKLGFCVHPGKSVFDPSQRLVFLGFILDSVNMTVEPTDEKKEKIISACSAIANTRSTKIRQVAELIGVLVSNFPGAQYGQLHYRNLERDKYSALVKSHGDFSGIIQLSPKALLEIKWWINNAHTLKKNIVHDNPHVVIQSDASNQGWGAVCGEKKAGGRWTAIEAECHINVLELQAAFFALKCFCSNYTRCHIQIQIDNTTALAYINHMGGTKSIQLDNLTIDLWNWCIARSLWVSAVHIAGKLNTDADEKSRHFSDKHEWMLSKQHFNDIMSQFTNLNIDMFASRLNNQLPVYCSWQADPGSAHVDAFSINWSEYNFYAFPPFSLIPKCLTKISQDKAQGILIAPLWPTQTWFPRLLQHLYQRPWIYTPARHLLRHPSYNQPHPLCQTLRLMVCPVSGNTSDTYNFQTTLPMCSWPHGEMAQKSSTPHTFGDGWSFVIKGRSITIHPRSGIP